MRTRNDYKIPFYPPFTKWEIKGEILHQVRKDIHSVIPVKTGIQRSSLAP